MKNTLIEKFFAFTRQAYYKWRREDRPIVQFVEKYLSDQDVEEFLETGKIEKFDLVKNFSVDELKEKLFGVKSEIKKPQYNISNLLTKVSLLSNSQIEALIYYLKKLKKRNSKFNKENLKLINDSFISQLLNVFVELKLNHLYFDKNDKEKLLLWLDKFLDRNDFNYINENKELVIEELEKVKKFFENDKPKETKTEQKNDKQLEKEKEQKEATNEIKKETKTEQKENKNELEKELEKETKKEQEDDKQLSETKESRAAYLAKREKELKPLIEAYLAKIDFDDD